MKYNKLEGFGIVLSRLTENDLEIVREWRNKPEVQKYMEYREHITSEMQKVWFNKVNNDNNYYFILEVNGEKSGVFNLKGIDYDKSIAEKGTLIWSDALRGKGIGYRGNVLLLDFAFDVLNLKYVRSHILKDNVINQSLNKKFGFELVEKTDAYNQEYLLTASEYKKNRESIIERISKYDTI